MSESAVRQVGYLVDLARDRSEQGRSTLIAEIGNLYCASGLALTDADRELMADIMGQLIHEVEQPVRRLLAQLFAVRADAPRELVVALANDEIDVARPILSKSEVLRDAELIDVITYRTMEHQLAIALRRAVSEPVSQALVEADHEPVIARLLANRGARFSPATMTRLVEKATDVTSYQEALVERHDLSLALAKKLYSSVSGALREQIMQRFAIDAATLDATLENAIDTVFAREVQAASHRHVSNLAEVEEARGAGADEALVNLLRHGHVHAFVDGLSKRTGLRPKLMRRIMFEPGGDRLAVTCKAIGLDKHAFVTIFLRARQGRLGDHHVDDSELGRAVACFDAIQVDKAKAAVLLWRQDRDA